MIIQIYEIQTPHEAEMIIGLGVDHVGSVLTSSTDRVDDDLMATVRMVQSAGCKSSLIPLFGRADLVSRAVDRYRPDILHFCETLPPIPDERNKLDEIVQLQRTIRTRFPELEIMRSIPIGRHGASTGIPSLAYAAVFEPWSDWFLTDTLLGDGEGAVDQNQPVTGFVGITGKTCDWDIARNLVQQSGIPVILAGGIGPDNVARGISLVRPAGVDSCSMTNAVNADGQIERFKKDPLKVRAMINNARKAAEFNEKENNTHD